MCRASLGLPPRAGRVGRYAGMALGLEAPTARRLIPADFFWLQWDGIYEENMPQPSDGRLASGRDLSPPSRGPVGSSASRLTGARTQGLGMPGPSDQSRGHGTRSRLPVPLAAVALGGGVLPASAACSPSLRLIRLRAVTVSPALGSRAGGWERGGAGSRAHAGPGRS